ncbi:hypothetical protein ABPG72_013866 [Tetrahymena utriculariae]
MASIVENRLFNGTVYVWIMSLPFLLLTAFHNQNNNQKNLEVNLNKFNTPDQLINHIYAILSMINEDKKNSSKRYILNAYIEYHKTICQLPNCPFRKMKYQQYLQLGKVIDQKVTEQMAQNSLTFKKTMKNSLNNFQNNNKTDTRQSLINSQAQFQSQNKGNNNKKYSSSFSSIKKAEQQNGLFDQQYQIFFVKQAIYNEIAENSFSSYKNDNFGSDAANIDNFLLKFKNLIEHTVALLMEFWSQLTDDSPDLQKLFDISTRKGVEECWKRLSLIESPAMVPVLRIYSRYITTVSQDNKSAQLMEKANRIDKRINKFETVLFGLNENLLIDGQEQGAIFIYLEESKKKYIFYPLSFQDLPLVQLGGKKLKYSKFFSHEINQEKNKSYFQKFSYQEQFIDQLVDKREKMDQIEQQPNQQSHENLQTSFQFSFQDKSYTASLLVIDYRLEVSIEQINESQIKWKELFSIEQIYKLNRFFLQFTDLQDIYGIISRLMKNSIKSITFNDIKMLVQLEFEQVQGKIQFTFQLHQCEIDTNEAIIKLSDTISSLQIKSSNQQKQIEQMLNDQSTQIEQIKDLLVKQNEQMKEYLAQQIQSLKTELQNEIQETKNEIALINQKIISNIITFKDGEVIKKWVTEKQINLSLIYKASYHGFEIEKVYEQCKDKSKVILLIKTKEGKRFGFYADCQIKNYNGCLAQNPNNIFLFSLDLKQKYTSNESNNNSYAFYSYNNYIAVGGGHDICLETNSNSNNSSYVNQSGYGKKEGLTGNALNGGTKTFTTSEVEIFEKHSTGNSRIISKQKRKEQLLLRGVEMGSDYLQQANVSKIWNSYLEEGNLDIKKFKCGPKNISKNDKTEVEKQMHQQSRQRSIQNSQDQNYFR